jgi:hypothetical protein
MCLISADVLSLLFHNLLYNEADAFDVRVRDSFTEDSSNNLAFSQMPLFPVAFIPNLGFV